MRVTVERLAWMSCTVWARSQSLLLPEAPICYFSAMLFYTVPVLCSLLSALSGLCSTWH